jgi:glyoxylase-like metal-dependent hydrolase (beta-lactamase superfamily II)
MQSLEWSVHVTPSLPTAMSDLPPGADKRWWSPMAATLIYGERDALLVDAFMTTAQAEQLADWVQASGKRLQTIYITHGHGDHWFGLDTLLKRFPSATALATPKVLDHMAAQADPQFLDSFWHPRFPGLLPARIAVSAQQLTDSFIELEGERIAVLDLGHTDTDDTTALHVPSIGLIAAGDAVYNDVHLYLAESPGTKRQQWLAALDTIESLRPSTVIAGHKRPGNPDTVEHIAETRNYILEFDRLAAITSTTEDLYHQMSERYPHRVNAGALWGSCRATKAS